MFLPPAFLLVLRAGPAKWSVTAREPSTVPPECVGGTRSASVTTAMSNVSLTVPARPASFAVTRTETVPTSEDCGVPENVRVAASNVSHDGSAAPSACVAV